MGVRWSPLKVKQATDKIEQAIAPILPALAEATRLIEATEKMPHLPQYVQLRLSVLRNEIDKLAGTQRYGQPEGSLHRLLKGIREDLPAADLAKEEAQFKKWLELFNGDQQAAETAMGIGTHQPADQPMLVGLAQSLAEPDERIPGWESAMDEGGNEGE